MISGDSATVFHPDAVAAHIFLHGLFDINLCTVEFADKSICITHFPTGAATGQLEYLNGLPANGQITIGPAPHRLMKNTKRSDTGSKPYFMLCDYFAYCIKLPGNGANTPRTIYPV
jgi:hypothetical protein